MPCPGSRITVAGGGTGPKSPLVLSLFLPQAVLPAFHTCAQISKLVGLVTFPRSLVISSGAGWGHTRRFLLQQLDWISGGPVARAWPSLAVWCCVIASLQPHTQTPAGQGEEWGGVRKQGQGQDSVK